MCLAVPGKIEKILAPTELQQMAEVNFNGLIKNVCIDFVPDVKIGEYVMVHVGFALNKVNEDEALEQLEAIAEVERIIIEKRNEISE